MDTTLSYRPTSVNNPGMAAWLREMRDATEFLNTAALRHCNGDHALCENAATVFTQALTDIGLSSQEAATIIATRYQLAAYATGCASTDCAAVECLWRNPQAMAAINQQSTLWEGVA